MLGILGAGDLHRPSQAQADQGFFSAAGSGCDGFTGEESAGLSAACEMSALLSFSSSGPSASATPSCIVAMTGLIRVTLGLSTQASMAAPGKEAGSGVNSTGGGRLVRA